MIQLEHKTLLEAGVHFGHLTRKWNPKMAPFIFMKQNGIHIVDLNKTIAAMQEAIPHLYAIARAGKKILFVATKKQAKVSVGKIANELGMPYVAERWLGGTLTNFLTIRKLLKRMSTLEKNMHTTYYKNLAKKERLVIAREQEKLKRLLQGLSNITRLPAALFVIDINKEHIAVKEARKLGIPIFALTDTNTNPTLVDFAIPGNDDAFRSIDLIVRYVGDAIKEGIEAYKKDKLEAAAKIETVGDSTITPKHAPNRGIKIVQGVVIKQNRKVQKPSSVGKTAEPDTSSGEPTTPPIATGPASPDPVVSETPQPKDQD
ncbi:30S ribosomal protein S2 [Candidatus Cardinium hertigii]|uniref:Small ribosomal subunit protein uS2 n=1 Tax=Candidatus Cardinium hertigii TaxID=247481 RepID=A0A2Z3LIC1_9BACT|nr:30S ribosomal protein S2 [Candidatus Cardinium hertigii]